MRLSIEVSLEQHQRLKAVAALCGKSIKDYVLERILPPVEEDLSRLEDFLKPRLDAAQRGEFSSRTVEQIIEAVRQEKR